MDQPVQADDARYIKLGAGGDRENDCLRNGKIHIGFGSGDEDLFPLVQEGRWDDFQHASKDRYESQATATKARRSVEAVHTDRGNTLWATFNGPFLYWGFIDPSSPPQRDTDGGTFRRIKGGWKHVDVAGRELRRERLSGALTRVAAFRGTVCRLGELDYVLRRINGVRSPEVTALEDARQALEMAAMSVTQRLGWKDFESLVDLVFARTNWRRQASVGGTEKTVDMVLWEPLIECRAAVQVKSHSSVDMVKAFASDIAQNGGYDHAFYVYHKGEVTLDLATEIDLIGPRKLAAMAVSADLVDWLVDRVA